MISGALKLRKLRSFAVFFYQASIFQVRNEPRRWHSFTAKPPATDLGKVINLQSGADCALAAVKASDSAAMMQLLHNGNKFFLNDNPKVVITDVGCGDGSWMLPVFFDFFRHAGKILFNGIEPHQPSLQKFEDKIIQANSQLASMAPGTDNRYELGVMRSQTLEQVDFSSIPRAHLTLCSHSLYYSKQRWETLSGPLEQHIFTKLLSSLKRNGFLCVILQSDDVDLSPAGHGIHAELEDITYPVMLALEGAPGMRHQDHVSYTTAERFECAINLYAERLWQEWGVTLEMSSMCSVSQVDLGEINCHQKDDSEKYPQSNDRARQMLGFYTKQYYSQYSADEQKALLRFIKDRCQTSDGNFVMTHINKVYLLKIDGSLKEVLSGRQSGAPLTMSCD